MDKTGTEDRALQLLGSGLSPEVVASAIGVSPSRISQLISDPEFSARVAELRFSNLTSQTARDQKYDSIEDSLLSKLENMLGFMFKPFEVLKAIQIINSAKRRGAPTDSSILPSSSQKVIPLLLPQILINTYTQINYSPSPELEVNLNNQVTKAGSQDLITIQSGNMNKLVDSTSPSLSSLNGKSISKSSYQVFLPTGT